MSIAKPTLDKAAAAVAFAESKPKSTTASTAEKRVFYAPEGYRRLTINVPEDIHKKLRYKAVELDTTITDILMQLVTKALDE